MKKIYYWSTGIWFLFAILGTINGIIRDNTYKNFFGDLLSHQISTLIFIFLIFVIIYFFFNKSNLAYLNKDLWIIGFFWLIATILFEFFFGHYIFANSWNKLFADYNIFNGRIWGLVLFSILIGPWLFGHKKTKKEKN